MAAAGWVRRRELWAELPGGRAGVGAAPTLTLPFVADAAKLLALCSSLVASDRVSARS